MQRLITARLAGQEIDLVACPAFWTNGSYARRSWSPLSDDE